jgi:hypothetical protein
MRLPLTGGCQCGKIRYAITTSRSWYTHATAPSASARRVARSRWVSSSRKEHSASLEPSHDQFSAPLRADARRRGGCVRSVAHGFAAVRNPARQRRIPCAWCGPALSMILRGFGQRRTTGPAANNSGLRCPRGTASSRPNLRTGAGREMGDQAGKARTVVQQGHFESTRRP